MRMAQSSFSHPKTGIKSSFLDFLEEGVLVDWFSRNGKHLLYGLIAFVALLLIIYRFSNSQTSKAEHTYLQAANDFNTFINVNHAQDPKGTEALERLTTYMKSHPELHAAYDGAIAQTLLDRNLIAEALPFAQSTLARTHIEDLPFYSDFAETTLMIAQKQYKQALSQATALQIKMTDMLKADSNMEKSFGPELFAFNLLRIAMLYQQLEDRDSELRTWEEWKRYAGLLKANPSAIQVNVDPQAFRFIIQKLAVGTLSLPDYIAYREKTLTKQE